MIATAIAKTFSIYYFTCRQQGEKEPVLRGVLQSAAVFFVGVQWSAAGKVVPKWMQGMLIALPVLMGILEKKVFACFAKVMGWIAPLVMLVSSAILVVLGERSLGGLGLAFLALKQLSERKIVPVPAIIGIETFGAVMTVAFGSWIARSALILSLARDLFMQVSKAPQLVDVKGIINPPEYVVNPGYPEFLIDSTTLRGQALQDLKGEQDYRAIRDTMAGFFSDEARQAALMKWAGEQGYEQPKTPKLYHLITCFLIHNRIIVEKTQ